MMADIQNERIIAFVEKMPAFPKSVQRVLQLTSDINSSAKDFVQVIESDPVMTIKILKVINSPFYGLSQKITSIQRAVVHIGLNTIQNLALSIAAISVLNKKNNANFNTQEFLLHSLTTALICKILAQKTNTPLPDCSGFFVAGLLHDFGKIIFAEFDAENFKRALEKSQQDAIPLHEAELEFIGINHAQAGKLLANKWGIESALINAIEHHHDIKSHDTLTHCVFAANQISKKMQFGFAGSLIAKEFPPAIFSQFNASLNDLITDLGDLSIIKAEALSFITL